MLSIFQDKYQLNINALSIKLGHQDFFKIRCDYPVERNKEGSHSFRIRGSQRKSRIA